MQSSKQEKLKQNSVDQWLNLSLSTNPSEALKQPKPQSQSSTPKNFSCSFCRRKFYSSQALGGHQNAHRKERSAVIKHYQLDNTITMTTLPMRTSMSISSLGVQPHSHIHKSGRHGTGTTTTLVSGFSEASTRFGLAWQPSEAADFMWPGSFRFNPHQQPEQKSSSSDLLDLNLKL